MKAIYKRELKAYLTNMLGYVFIAVNLIIVGIYFTYYNLNYAYPYIDYTLSGTSFIFMITTPLLTMRAMSDERRQKTDQLLLTAPVDPWQIVVGKYLALVTVYLIPIVIIGFYPLMLTSFGTVYLKEAYTTLFGFFMMGCAYLALGLFISSTTDSPVLSAVVTFIACFLVYMASSVSSFFSDTSFATYIALAAIIALLALLIYSMVKNQVIAVGFFIVLFAALTVCFFVKPALLEGGIQVIIEVFDFSSRFDDFLNGIFSVTSLVYYISAIVVCCTLAVQSIQKRRWS